jgi:1-acyl-sn-glycerol-3-phosphate acyltransferase
MKTFMEGIGLLAKKLDVQIVPAHIDGLYQLKKARTKFARSGQITVTIGDPLRFARDDDPSSITRELEERVASLGLRMR